MHPNAIYHRPVGTIGRKPRSVWPGICAAALLGALVGIGATAAVFLHPPLSSDPTPTAIQIVNPVDARPLPSPAPDPLLTQR